MPRGSIANARRSKSKYIALPEMVQSDLNIILPELHNHSIDLTYFKSNAIKKGHYCVYSDSNPKRLT